ncbi:aromatic ring-hydroxylating oxygenase subunit alpha [Zavarzinia sp. CC-PAN008]|uniref:aromatic ring-hydroxylating oxygenase subunit alpha n=1 Tax=Zavarzinia sp. CC-PAN008 TaxID=3243332 RepID=UPI003F7423D4
MSSGRGVTAGGVFGAGVPEQPFSADVFSGVRRPLLEAETLPPWCYTDPGFYRREVERVFGRAWNFAGRADLLKEQGSYITLDFCGVPLVMIRDRDGTIRCLANSCRHRGARLVEGEGRINALSCPYHAWGYGLDGHLRVAPQMDDTKGFCLENHNLVGFRVETWGGFLFFTFDPDAPPLLQWLGDLPERLAAYDLESLVTVKRDFWDLECNWKIYIENAMESYHVPVVHAKTIQLQKRDINPPVYGVGEWAALYTRHTGSRALEQGDTGFPYLPNLTGMSAEGTYYVMLYPSTMLALTFDTVWWLELHPLGPTRTRLIAGYCFAKETIARPDFDSVVQRYYKRWGRSIPEDNDISVIQQAGLNSPFAQPGRYSALEPLVHDLANWVLDRVVDQRPATAGERAA